MGWLTKIAIRFLDPDGNIFGVKHTNDVPHVHAVDLDGNPISIQYPLSVDGDSVYVKDLDIPNCDNGDFSGVITDYFDSLKTINSNTTGDNPKIIKLWFKRTVYSHGIGFGCDNLANSFGTSITIKLLGSGEAVRFTKTFTAIDPNSFLAEFGPKAFNGIILEFNTASTVCLSNLTIAKSAETNATLHGLDPNGDVQDVNVTVDGDLTVSDNSSGLAIAQGKVTGSSFIHKFGAALDFDVSDGFVTVWDGAEDGEAYEAMQYTYSTTNDIDYVVAENAGDTQDVEIQGLNSSYEVVVQTVTLAGQTPVVLTTPLLRVFRAKNMNSSDFAGHVFVYRARLGDGTPTVVTGGVPQTGADVRAVVHSDNNQTLMSIYTIPAGKTGYMRDWFASTAGAKRDSQHTIKLLARPFGGVFQLKHLSNISVTGTSYIQHKYEEPEIFTEKTDIEIRMDTDTDIAGVSAGFDIVLVDN